MTEGIRGYLLSVCAISILVSLVQTILPQGTVRRVAGFTGGMLILLTAVSPVAGLQPAQLAKSVSRIQLEMEALETGAATGNRELMAGIIKQRCKAYILDKAAELGMSIEADVELDETSDYPYPVKAVLTGTCSAQQKEQLSAAISENLGIPGEQQEWNEG